MNRRRRAARRGGTVGTRGPAASGHGWRERRFDHPSRRMGWSGRDGRRAQGRTLQEEGVLRVVSKLDGTVRFARCRTGW